MAVKRSGLGRNLSALLGNSTTSLLQDSMKIGNEFLKLGINAIQPGKFQPRGEIEDEPLQELAASIKQQGLIQPIVVREIEKDHYEIIAGERRWRACQLAGLSEIPAIIRQVDDETAMAMALVENLQREDLNAMDQARALQRLVTEFDLTHQQVANLVAKSRTAVSNFLRLLSLNADVGRLVEHGDLDMGHARALLMLPEEQQSQVAKIIVAKNLSVRETEKLVERVKKGKPNSVLNNPIHSIIQQQVDGLAKQFKTKITIKPGKEGKGSLVIQYASLQNLEGLINQLMGVTDLNRD